MEEPKDKELQRIKIEGELEIARAKIKLEREQWEADKEKSSKKHKGQNVSPVLATVWVALIGLFGTVIAGLTKGCSEESLERRKFEYTLIQNALNTKDTENAAEYLAFLDTAGLLETIDPKNLEPYVKGKKSLPVRPDSEKKIQINRSQIKPKVISVLALEAIRNGAPEGAIAALRAGNEDLHLEDDLNIAATGRSFLAVDYTRISLIFQGYPIGPSSAGEATTVKKAIDLIFLKANSQVQVTPE